MIGVIGISHKSAPVHIREKFSLNSEEIVSLGRQLCDDPHVEEVVILSTCNRTEIYFLASVCGSRGAFTIIRKLLTLLHGEKGELDNFFYQFRDEETVRHLFRVVSSLDSMVLGEYQVVSQVKEAFRLARENKMAGKILKRLFNKALETGKLVRTKTAMSRGAFSVSYAAVEKCHEQFGDLQDRKILLIGAGETGELVIKNMCKKGCRNITITNRTKSRAEELARRYHGRVLPFCRLLQGIGEAEIIVSSVSSRTPLLSTEDLGTRTDGKRQFLLIDLGVPRNFHPALAHLPGVCLLNVDDLKEVVIGNREKKQTYVLVAEKLIEEKVTEFSDWLSIQDLSPAIRNIIRTVRHISDQELAQMRKSAKEEDLLRLEKYFSHVSEKLSNELIKNLKQISNNGKATEYVNLINDLFSVTHEN